jgi:hypothetical protein
MDDRTYKRMTLGCSCGHVSRSTVEEARHRHNFPALCRGGTFTRRFNAKEPRLANRPKPG